MKWAKGTPAVAVVHNVRPHEWFPLASLLTSWALGPVRGAVLHSSAVASELRLVTGVVNTAVVPHPPNLLVTAAPLPPFPPYRLAFVGYVRPYKGLDIAIESIRILRDRGMKVSLTVAGEFWDPVDRWVQLVDRMGVQEAVELKPGYLPDDELVGLLSRHHAIVVPYRSASQSGIVPLAYAAGRPVVATAVGGLPEVVIEGETGALASAANGTAFAEATARLLGDIENLAVGASRASGSWADVASAVVTMSLGACK